MTKFKICGLRDAKHAIASANAGADYMGFNFVEGVRRQLLEEDARSILSEYRDTLGDAGPKIVGLFANQPLDFVNRIVESCGLDYVQLCGDEQSDYWRNVSVPVMKPVRVRDDGDRQAVIDEILTRADEVISQGHIVLLDKHEVGSLGGTGRVFDWSIAKEVASRFDVFIAGGLSPDNVGEAISTVHPWGVDVSSGVETNGVKDAQKIKRFAEEVRSVKSL